MISLCLLNGRILIIELRTQLGRTLMIRNLLASGEIEVRVEEIGERKPSMTSGMIGLVMPIVKRCCVLGIMMAVAGLRLQADDIPTISTAGALRGTTRGSDG